MSRTQYSEKLVDFLGTIRKPDAPLGALSESSSLVSAGLIDSLAILEIIVFLETEFGIDFSEAGVDPDQLTSISGILDLIESQLS